MTVNSNTSSLPREDFKTSNICKINKYFGINSSFFLDLESWSQSINSVAPIPRGQSIWGVGVGVSEILWQFYALTWKQLKLT